MYCTMLSRRCLSVLRRLNKISSDVCAGAPRRNLYSSTWCGAFAHLSGENQFAHQVLRNTSDRYQLAGESPCAEECPLDKFIDTLNPPASLKVSEIIEAFQVLSDFAHKESIDISSNIFDDFVDLLTDKFKEMSLEQLFLVFNHFRKWPSGNSSKTRNFIEIWTALDDVLKARCESWSLNELFIILDHIYRTFLIAKFTFPKYAIAKLMRKSKNLSPAEVVQLSFYAGACRWKFEMFELESRFFDSIDFLSIEEIGIVCMGFFKTQTPFRDPRLLKTIMRRLELSDKPPSNILLSSILKMIKYSITEENNVNLSTLFDWCINHIDGLSSMACTHLAIAGTTTRLKHIPLLTKLATKLNENVSEIRIKDLERMAGAYGMFNLDICDNIPVFELVVGELRKPERLNEIRKHPFAFVNCLMFLAIQGRYPLDLITYALSKEFFDNHYKDHIRNGKSMFILSNSVAIESKKIYKGPFLDEKHQFRLAKYNFRYMPERGEKYPLNTEQKAIMDVMSTIADYRGGWKFVKTMHLLPHFDKGDFVICNGVSEAPVRVENYFPKKEFGKLYKVPDHKKTWLVVVCSGPHGVIWNSSEPIGITHMKMRQLKAIGYTPVHVPLMEWQELKTTVEKNDYLRKLFLTVSFNY